jgi:hypothetical protein
MQAGDFEAGEDQGDRIGAGLFEIRLGEGDAVVDVISKTEDKLPIGDRGGFTQMLEPEASTAGHRRAPG